MAVRDCCFRRFKASSRVGSVAERLGSRAAAAAQRKRTLGNRVGGAVPINRRHIITLNEIGSVLNHLDRCHLDVLRHCPCHRNNLAHTEQARTLSPVGLFARVGSDGLETGLAVSPSAPADPIASRRGLAHPRRSSASRVQHLRCRNPWPTYSLAWTTRGHDGLMGKRHEVGRHRIPPQCAPGCASSVAKRLNDAALFGLGAGPCLRIEQLTPR